MAGSIQDKAEIYKPLGLKLYQKTLCKLFDYNWTGLNLFYYLKPYVRKGRLLNCKTNGQGVLSVLSKYVWREFFYSAENDIYSKYFINDVMLEEGDIDGLRGDELIWHIEYVYNTIRFHCAFEAENFLILKKLLEKLKKLCGNDESKYSLEITKGRRRYISIYNRVINEYSANLIEFEDMYSKFIVDRIFFDRELCAHIAERICEIGLYGDDNSANQSWIKRKQSSDLIKSYLLKRESGQCVECRATINKKNMTVDHIIPLGKGGHNDIVNLQAVCNNCNSYKKDSRQEVRPSIPDIIKSKYDFKKIIRPRSMK